MSGNHHQSKSTRAFFNCPARRCTSFFDDVKDLSDHWHSFHKNYSLNDQIRSFFCSIGFKFCDCHNLPWLKINHHLQAQKKPNREKSAHKGKEKTSPSTQRIRIPLLRSENNHFLDGNNMIAEPASEIIQPSSTSRSITRSNQIAARALSDLNQSHSSQSSLLSTSSEDSKDQPISQRTRLRRSKSALNAENNRLDRRLSTRQRIPSSRLAGNDFIVGKDFDDDLQLGIQQSLSSLGIDSSSSMLSESAISISSTNLNEQQSTQQQNQQIVDDSKIEESNLEQKEDEIVPATEPDYESEEKYGKDGSRGSSSMNSEPIHEQKISQNSHPDPQENQLLITPQQICQHGNLYKSVPLLLHAEWIDLVAGVCSEYIKARESNDTEAMIHALVNYLMLPQRVLTHHHGGKNRSIRDVRMQMKNYRDIFHNQQSSSSQSNSRIPTSSSSSQNDSDSKRESGFSHPASTIKRAVALVNNSYESTGSIRKAAVMLAREPLKQIETNEMITKMRALFPESKTEGKMPDLPAYPALISIEGNAEWSKHLRRICNGSGPGPSGWTFEMMRACISDKTCLSGFACMASDIVNGKLTDPRFKEYWLATRGIAIPKPDGGVRPIGIAEALYRAASSFILKPLLPEAAKVLEPINLAVGVQGGCEIVYHCVKYFLIDKGLSCFCSDFSNAFNSASRCVMLEELFKCNGLRRIWRLAHWAYSEPSKVYINNRDGSLAGTIVSEEGSRQGDVIAPLLFCLCVRSLYDRVSKVGKDVTPIAFCDDLFLLGEPDQVVKCAIALKEESAKVGLNMNMKKCKLLYFNKKEPIAENTLDWLKQEQVKLYTCDDAAKPNAEVAKILGVPISVSSGMVSHEVVKIVQSHKYFFDSLLHHDMPVMHAFILLRLSAIPRFNYLLRCIDPDTVLEGAKLFDEMNRETAIKKMKIAKPDEVDVAARRLQMPIKPIGAGLRSAVLVRHGAYLASQAQAAAHLRRLTHSNGPEDGTLSSRSIAQALETFEPFSAKSIGKDVKVGDSLPKLPSLFYKFFSENRPSHLQHRLTKVLDTVMLEKEKKTLSASQTVLVESASKRGANLVLSAKPSSRNTTLRDAHTIFALRFHMMLPPSAVLPIKCACQIPLADQPYHHLHCNDFGGQLTTRRHHMIVRWLAQQIRWAGGSALMEQSFDAPDMPEGSEGKLRIDIDAFLPACETKRIMIDVSIVDPVASRNLRLRSATAVVENRKKDTYSRLCQQLDADLCPFVLETTGAMNEDSLHLLDLISQSRKSTAIDNLVLVNHRRRMQMELVVLLQRCNAEAMDAGIMHAHQALRGRGLG